MKTKSKNKKNNKTQNWLFVILWMLIIFFFSHQPGLASGLSGDWDFVLRKMAHITEYAVLCFLLVRVIGEYKVSFKKTIIFSILISIIYAISDEYHQTFIFARQGNLRDILIDSFGVLLFAWWWIRKMVK